MARDSGALLAFCSAVVKGLVGRLRHLDCSTMSGGQQAIAGLASDKFSRLVCGDLICLALWIVKLSR